MSAAFLLDGGQLFVTQAAVQSIVVTTLVPDPDAAFTRWTDALIGGAVALVAATVVPAAPLRRPREQAAVVVRKIADAAAGGGRGDGRRRGRAGAGAAGRRPVHRLPDPRAAGRRGRGDGGGGVVAVPGPAPRPACGGWSELVDPLDRALRSTRVLVRQTAVAAYHRRPVPHAYALLAADLAAAADQVADELADEPDGRRGAGRRCWRSATATGQVERADELSAEAMLAQLRSVVADLLLLTGMDQLEATDALPPPR